MSARTSTMGRLLACLNHASPHFRSKPSQSVSGSYGEHNGAPPTCASNPQPRINPSGRAIMTRATWTASLCAASLPHGSSGVNSKGGSMNRSLITHVADGFLILATAARLSGCFSFPLPPGSSLGHASPAPVRVNRAAWLEAISIRDPQLDRRDSTQESLSLATAQYIGEAGYFSRINQLPGRIGSDDYILRFEVEQYRMERSAYPAGPPLALITLGFYAFFGGPIYRDTSDLVGTLTVENAKRETLVQVSESIHDSHTVSMWSTEYALPSGIQERTQFIHALMEKAITELQRMPAASLP